MKWVKYSILLIALKLHAQPHVKNIPISTTNYIDSLTNWIYLHRVVDSEYILTLHRISRRLSEIDTRKSFEYYEKVLSLSDSLHFTYGKSLAQINLGILLSNSGNIEESNNAYFKAIDQAEACRSLRLKSISFNNLGENFKILKYFSKCKECLKKAITINTEIRSWEGVAANYESLQRSDLEENFLSNAYIDLLKGLPFALKTNDSYILSLYYIGFGKLAAINNQTDTATYFFKKATEQARLQNDLGNEFQICLAEAQYLKSLKLSRKVELLDSALYIAKKTDYLQGVVDAAKLLSSIYKSLRIERLALFYNRVYRSAEDSLVFKKNERNAIIKESEWEMSHKEQENEHLKNLAELQQKEITVKNQLLFASVVSIILGITTVIFIYKSIQAKKTKQAYVLNQKIVEAEAAVLRSEKDQLIKLQNIRSQIASDLHDDIGSSLSGIMIMSELVKKGNEESKSYIDKIKQNAGSVIENMNDIVWAINPNNDTADQIYVRMQNFAASLLEKKNIKLYFEINDSALSAKFTMDERKNVYLTFKEAIHNAFKYSNCDKIFISIYREYDNIVLKIYDTGKGFDLSSNISGNGIKNMKKRALEIKGKLEILSSESGTSIKLYFKPTLTGI